MVHRGFPYLSNWLGLREIATLEPKPGIEPSSAHLSAVLAQLQRQPAKMVIHGAYQGDRASAWLASRASIPVVELPFTVGGTAQAQDWQTQLTAVGTAMLGALLLSWSGKHWPQIQEALIGVLFVLAATGAVVLISNDPHGGEHLKNLLIGQILWVIPADLAPVAVLYTVVLALWFGARERLGSLGFYLLFAVVVTASVQLVGVYLVFASLIIPALATRGLCSVSSRAPLRLALGYTLGGVGYAAGLVLSALFDLPAGAIIVWMLALSGVLLAVVSRFNFCSCVHS